MTISSLSESSIRRFNSTLIRPVPSSNHRYLPLPNSLPNYAKGNDEIEVIDVNPKSTYDDKPLSESERRWKRLEKEDDIGNLDNLLKPSATSKPFFSQVDEIVQAELRKIKEGIASSSSESTDETDPLGDDTSPKKVEKSVATKPDYKKKEPEKQYQDNVKNNKNTSIKNTSAVVPQTRTQPTSEYKVKFVPAGSQNLSSRPKDVLTLKPPLSDRSKHDRINSNEKLTTQYEEEEPEKRVTIASTRSRRKIVKPDYTYEAPRSLDGLKKEKDTKQSTPVKEKPQDASKDDSDIEMIDDEEPTSKIDISRVAKQLKENNLDMVQMKSVNKKSISRQDATKTVEESSDEDNDDEKESNNNVIDMLKDSIKHLSPPKKYPTNVERSGNMVIPQRSGPNVTSSMSEKKMVTVNRQNMFNKVNAQSNISKLTTQHQLPKAIQRSAEVISLDDEDEDDIVEVIKAEDKKSNNISRVNPSQLLINASNRKMVVPLKRKEQPSPNNDFDARSKSPPRKRLEINKILDRREPLELNKHKTKEVNVPAAVVGKRPLMVGSSSSNKELQANKQPINQGQKRGTEKENPKNVPSDKTKILSNVNQERRTRGSTKIDTNTIIEKKVIEKKVIEKKVIENSNDTSAQAKKSEQKSDSSPKTNNKVIKDKKDEKSEVEAPVKSSKKNEKDTKLATQKKEKKEAPSNNNTEGLPEGWRRELAKRTRGAATDKPEIYVFSPEGKRFRSKTELQKFCKDNPKNKIAKIDLDAIYVVTEEEKK